jgi:hypothetical protein
MKCDNCNEHEAEIKWIGEMSALEYGRNPQNAADWCMGCCLKEQLKQAKERAAEIPKMEKDLKEWKIKHGI